ncbi:MAG TPA: aldolase/citrate lyase family protein, partial [Clostridia bacterium]|nr:aldolase/citrate lyase family protein [Clostridia bacterium]
VIPQCETKECLEIIEDIVEIEGVDGIFIGPFDLSISLGIPAQFSNEIFIAAINRIQKACQNAGKPIFIYTGNIEDARKYLANGYDGVAYNMDAAVLVNAYRKIVNIIKSV